MASDHCRSADLVPWTGTRDPSKVAKGVASMRSLHDSHARMQSDIFDVRFLSLSLPLSLSSICVMVHLPLSIGVLTGICSPAWKSSDLGVGLDSSLKLKLSFLTLSCL